MQGLVVAAVETPFARLQEQIEALLGDAGEAAQMPLRLVPEILDPIDVSPLVPKPLRMVDPHMVEGRDIQGIIAAQAVRVCPPSAPMRQIAGVNDERDHGDGSAARAAGTDGGWWGALGPPGAPGSVFETYMNASKSGQLSRKGSMSVSRSAVWKESARLGRRPPSCSATSARPVAACATIAGRVVSVARARSPAHRRAVPVPPPPGHAPVPGGRAPLCGGASHEAEG